jgi:hypothetical protein
MISGPILFVARQFHFIRMIHFGSGSPPDVRRATLDLAGYAEPGSRVLQVADRVDVEEAVDDHGNSLKPAPEQDRRFAFREECVPWEAEADLQFPVKNPGTKLVRFRGSQMVRIGTEPRRVEVVDLTHARRRKLANGPAAIYFEGCTRRALDYVLSLSVSMEGQEDEERVEAEAKSGLQVLDADGHRLQLSDWGGDGSDGTVWHINRAIVIPGVAGPGSPVPTKLVWNMTTATRDVKVPIVFDNLDMDVFKQP